MGWFKKFWIVLFFLAFNAKAEGPFGKVTGMGLNAGQDQCSATTILRKAIRDSGVNILDTVPQSVWSCQCTARGDDGTCQGGTERTRLLMLGCKPGDEIQCYS